MKSLIKVLLEKDESLLTLDFLKKTKRDFSRDNKLKHVPSNIQLLRAYHEMIKSWEILSHAKLEEVLKKRPVRSMSGIVSVQVLTKPFWCPGKCIFCPNDFTMPKSYINTEPGAMRALLNNFDPIKQVYNRLLSLTMTGHKTDKIEMIVLWWTWDVYPKTYKEWFIKSLYDACNTFPEYYKSLKFETDDAKASHYTVLSDFETKVPETLEETLDINELANNRIIWLTIETRPEYVNDENCQFWRRLWVTRLEMWVQSTDDAVLEANKRWHSTEQSRQAVHTLRKYWYKFSLHLMPWLYKSTNEKDIKTFDDMYDDIYFKPDEIKFYPTSVIPNTELYDLYAKWEYKPLDTDVIKDLIKYTFLNVFPPYTRIKRLIRDIPSTEIVAGSNITNLSQLTHSELKKNLKNTQVIKDLYNRLYKDYNLCHSEKALFDLDAKLLLAHDKVQDTIITMILGQDPDLEWYRNYVSLDTRSREIRQKYKRANWLPATVREGEWFVNLVVRKYLSSVWVEYFISFEDEKGFLFGFVRLCLPEDDKASDFAWLWEKTAMVRELHIYWQVKSIQKNITDGDGVSAQHKWFGWQLMFWAEQFASNNWYERLSVISGIGVREYYRKLGYDVVGSYMVKWLE